MAAPEEHPFSSTDSAHQSFTHLYIFLRDAFQQKGLVSIPPEVLQRFKQCPLQDIECDEIVSFAKLFEGTYSSNRFRLEANSFVYTVQILFHLRQNLVQERILHHLMVSVRLLKDEKEASKLLSELAEREIDRFAVARKRTVISNKLVPWLLKHFSQDSTSVRLKLVATQFLFYLLQGDEEAKKLLSSASQKERWSLGRTISTSLQLPLRILSANILRELLLAAIDLRLFWPAELHDSNDIQLNASFIADTEWLETTVEHLHHIDIRHAAPEESRAKIHNVSSLLAWPVVFADTNSRILATIGESLLFIIPADKKRALQTLEVPLNPDMQWNKRPFERWRSDSVGLKQEVELRLQLRNTGFYIFNGSKNAVDEVALSFSTEDDCDSFCETMARSLQNLPSQSAALGKPRPKKQSKAVMIDLSQDVVISGDTQLLSQPLGVPHKVSASRRIDMSTSRETSMSSSSLREINEEEFLPLQPRKDQERLLHDTRQVQRDSPHSSKVEAKMTPSGVKLEKLPLDSVAPAFEDTTSQGRPTAEDRKDHLPQQEDDNIAAPKFTVATSESLQHLAFNALRHSARISNRTTANRAESNSRSEECEKAPDTALSGDSSLRPPSSPRTQPHLAKKMALKSTKQVTSTSKTTLPSQTKPPESKTSTNLPNRRRAANSVPKGEEAVDWDEDLKSDGNDHEDESSLASRSKRSVSRNTKDGVKKHATTKKIPGTSGTRKKAPSKAKVKESKPQPTSTNTGIGATRSRRAAANIAYVEQSEEEEQSQDSLDGAKDVPSPVQPKPVEAATAGSNTNNDDNQPQPPLADGPNLINVVRSPDAEARSTHVSAEQTVEVHASSEGIPALAEQDIERTATERGPNDQSGSETSAPGTQKSNDTVTSIDATKSKVQAAVEVVDDSHPLEKKQLANIVGAARKSFGSALMDVMNEIGMQPIQSASVVGVRTKPFGDKVAFVESVKTALEQSPSKSPVKKPGSARTKHIQTPSTNKSKPEASTGQQFTRTHLEATRPNEPVQSGVFAPDPPLDEGIGVPISPQKTSAAEPTRETERANSPNGSLSLAPGETFDLQQPQASKAENGQQASEANKSSPSSHQLPEKPISPAKTDHLPPVSFSRDRTTTLHNNERKRRSDVPVRSPKRTKRARMTNPDPHKSQRDADLKEGLPLQSHPTAESRGHAAPNRLRRLEPSARDLGKTAHTDKAPIKALVLQKQKPADTAEPQSVHPKNKSPTRIPNPPEPQAQTPQLIPGDGQQRLLPDDNLNRKAHLVGFSAKGPRNQGMLSSDARRRGVEQSGSVPTEKHKHLAFKKLHAGSKADEHPTEAVLNQNQLSNGDRKHRVSFSFSEPESINDDLHVDQDNAKDTLAAPNTAKAENGKSASQTSKVDENGSPRLHLRETSRLSLPSNDPAASDDSEDLDENMDSASIFEDSEVESASFGLTAVVTKFTVKMQKVAKIKPVRSRPSIGLGKLLDQSFPQASTKIATGAFKAPVPADTTVLNEASPKPRGTKYLNHNQTMIQKLESGGRPDKPIAVNQDVTPSFDIENLNVSVAQEQPSSSATGRVRRLRSSTPQSPGPEKPQPDDSPPSFNTRLGKMIMPPPPRKERDKVVTPEDYGGGLHKGREQSAMIDAETTLVNGEAFEEDTNQSSPPRHQKSSSSEEENKGGPSISVSQQAAVGTLQRDRRIWNQKVAETQQTVLEILNQVSRKLLVRFSNAEEGIQFKLDHYRYGGHKILNNLVEQYDHRVTQEKEIPSPRISEHRKRLMDTITLLQQAKRNTRRSPSLDDLKKSHDKRSCYVLANLQKFQQRLQG